MRHPSLVIFLGALALLSAGCNPFGGGGAQQGQEPPAEQPPAGETPVEQAPAEAPAAEPPDAADAKKEPDGKPADPDKAAAGKPPQAAPQLIRATQPEELARKQQQKRSDPFGNLVVPLVQAGAQQAAGRVQPPTQVALTAEGASSSIPTGGALLLGGNLAVNLGSRIQVAPSSLAQIPNLDPREVRKLPELPLPIGPDLSEQADFPLPGSARAPGAAPQFPGSPLPEPGQVPNLEPREVRKLPELPLPIGPDIPEPGPEATPPIPSVPSTPPPPPIPPAPQPNLARAIEILGVQQESDGNVSILLKAPNEKTARYVEVGDRVANGEVLVKRVIFNQSSEPIVVLEQSGVEVRRRVGEPAEFPETEEEV